MSHVFKTPIIIFFLIFSLPCLTSCKKKPTLPTVTTTNVTNITQMTATSGGNVTSDGNAEVTDRGVCWSTIENPTTSRLKTSAGPGTGAYTCDLALLDAGTKYYVRAYATNSEGTGYGNQLSFNTSPILLATLTTTSVTSITSSTAVSGGNITDDGGGSITERGLCWGTSTAPTIEGSHISSGTGTGTFTSSPTGLSPNATYYVRAYAINIAGTAYGNELTFTTPPSPTVVTNVSDIGIGSLRYALEYANSTIGIKETIAFNIPGTGPFTIRPSTQLPIVTDPVVIDGYTQPGSKPATASEPATILIEIVGNASDNTAGLILNAGNSSLSGISIKNFRLTMTMAENGNNIIKGNYFTGINGTRNNIYVNSPDNEIGGRSPASRNVITLAEAGDGIEINNTNGHLVGRNRIIGNYIGIDPTGEIKRGNDFAGISIVESPDNIIGGPDEGDRNVISGNITGISISGADATGNRVEGNYIGTNARGTKGVGNDTGISIRAPGNFIGGSTPGAGNLISGNGGPGGGYTIILNETADGNVIQGNMIGTDRTGFNAIPNQLGAVISITGGNNNQIGGLVQGARNIISGNWENGIQINGTTEDAAEGNKIQGNYIGTDISGKGALGNGSNGVELGDYANNNIIGGTEPGSGNSIAFNENAGVAVRGTLINSTGNTILSNSIYSNGGLGIDLGDTGITPNDSVPNGTGGYIYDSDIGPNNLQDYPVLKSITYGGGEIKIVGSLRSAINTEYTVQFFASKSGDESDYGEGQEYLGSATVTTNSSGIATFSKNFSRSTSGEIITATATDANGNTSEFSASMESR